MAEKIIKKIYYRITFTLASPLMVGSGENQYTDKDIVRDANGDPYIPASSIAGVCRSALGDDNKINQYFGFVKINRGDNNSSQKDSALIFYDGKILFRNNTETYFTSVRDSVKLDEFKTAVEGAKFDMEILEPGTRIRTYLEQSFYTQDDVDYAGIAAGCFLNNRLVFGAKSMRGYGEIKDAEVEFNEFDLTDKEDVRKWLAFDLYKCNVWITYKPELTKEAKTLTIALQPRYGISIRKYTTAVSTKDETNPDYSQLTSHFENGAVEPVIPGTTWAGAFLHQMRILGMPQNELEDLFGYVHTDRSGKKTKSSIRFSESRIRRSKKKKLSRNAIDRFSGGTVDSALFTEETRYSGETELKITITNAAKINSNGMCFLAAAITDLHYGYLAVGGETSIGRGLFTVTQINDLEINDDTDVYSAVLSEIQHLWGKETEI